MTREIAVGSIKNYEGHKLAVYTLSPSWRKGYFFSAGSEGIVAEWNRSTGEGKAFADAGGPVFGMKLFPVENVLALGLENGEVSFIDLNGAKVISKSKNHSKAVFDFSIIPGTELIAASSADGCISVWNTKNYLYEGEIQISPKSIRTLIEVPGKENLLCGSSDGKIRLLNNKLKVLNEWQAHSLSVFRLLFSPDGTFFLSGSRDAFLKSWNLENPEPLLSLPAHMFSIHDIAFHHTGNYFFTCSMDKTIKLWDKNLNLLKVLDITKHDFHEHSVNRIIWTGESIVSCSDDRKVMEFFFDGLPG